MADGSPNDHRQNPTAADTDGGNKRSSLATQSTISVIADGNTSDHSTVVDFPASGGSNAPVAEGLYSLISSVMKGFDSRADATSSSQDQLAFALDRVTGELDKLLEDAPSPFIMQHAVRISGLRKRVKALNTVLKSIQRQIDNMDRMLSAGLVQETLVGESSGQQPTM